MKIFNYDSNGVYIGESVADESPLEPGVFLIPANCTKKEPPLPKENFSIVFNGNEWVYVKLKRKSKIKAFLKRILIDILNS